MRWLPRTGLWQHRNFLRLWAAQSVSALGSRITRTALPVIAVLAVNGSAIELGLLMAISMGPGAVVALLAAGHVDRSAKRPVLIAADVARALLVVTIPVAAWLGALTMIQLYLVAGAVGCATAVFQITDNAYLPVLIGSQQLVEGNAKLEATESIAEITGPGLAGVLIEIITAPLAMVVDAVTYLVSGMLLLGVNAPETPAEKPAATSLGGDVRLGFWACWSEPLVRPLLLAHAVATLSGGFFFALYMLYCLDDLALSPGVVGLIISVGGIGSLIGALLTSRLAGRFGSGPAMLLCLTVAQAAALLIPLAGGPLWLLVALLVAHQLVGDGFHVAYMVQAVSLRQIAVPGHVLARANAVFTAAGSLLLPVGAVVAGAVGEAMGVRTALWIGVSAGLLAPLLLVPLLSLRRLPVPPSAP